MKKIIVSFLFALMLNSINAQTPIIAIDAPRESNTPNAYYKDKGNSLNQFVGTWVYTNTTTNTTWEIRLFKKLKNFNSSFYEDMLYGEYKYVENDVVKINTLPQLGTVFPNVENHSISGNFLLSNFDTPVCTECPLSTKRVIVSLHDPIKKISHRLFAKIVISGGQTIMKVNNTSDGRTYPNGVNTLDDVMTGVKVGQTIPVGKYDFIKQP